MLIHECMYLFIFRFKLTHWNIIVSVGGETLNDGLWRMLISILLLVR